MFEGTYTRRAMLRRGLATAGAGALVGAAGCSSIPNLLGGTTPYAKWLPAPAAVDDSDHYNFTYFNVDDLEAHEGEIDDGDLKPPKSGEFLGPVDIDWQDASGVTTLGFGGLFGFGGFVVEADFDRDDAISDLEANGFTEDSEHEGYALMLGSFEKRVYAVGDGAIVLSVSLGGDTDMAEAIIDAKTGNVDRYGDDSDDMSALIGALGGGTYVKGSTTDIPEEADPADGVFDNMVARGEQAKIKGQDTALKHVVVYESSDDVDTDDLREWVDENNADGERFGNLDDPSYNSNGRKGVITGTVPTDDS
ncbi:hypothetical protein [Haloarcula salinisoli]|uniref:Uncharacterized protein n=1 Tax=Haloarcula salinisoli TaxID=2487746 RepID=A0A8J8C839_9EURY|nr:hypothetical protein [Halomicroarcula salinisoli]MBX0286675.1 hypothetical protein [Halomicroarcula salinisoli]MBX0303986.1 hypothetical protein [Halomicroarcula salinisoli]